jgi:hypothetical protein
VLTSPLQIPVMAGRDAALLWDSPWLSAATFPLAWPTLMLAHSGLVALHVLDLASAPLHLLNDLEAPQIYTVYEFPMRLEPDAPLGEEALEMVLWSAGMLGGSAISYWFYVHYVPGLFSF